MPADSLIDSSLFIKRDLGNPSSQLSAIVSNHHLVWDFASQLLLYD
jgi:hypothetical protein